VEIDESNSNFGFNLPWWDRLFGTYRAQPRAGHVGMRIGVEHLQSDRPTGLLGLLRMPFSAGPGDYAIGQRWSSERKPVSPASSSEPPPQARVEDRPR
jgi:hypothetical protein